jgi:hypothetical protein
LCLQIVPATRGYRNSLGVAEEPDEPEDIEILSVTDAAGKCVSLTDEEEQQIIDECWDDLKTQWEDVYHGE